MSAIRIELELRDGSFVSGMLRAGQSIASFKKELERVDPHFRKLNQAGGDVVTSFNRVDGSARTALGTVRDLSIVAGLTALAFQSMTGASNGFIGNIIRVNAEMEKLRFQMEGMSTAKDPIKDAADSVAYLREMTTKAPFSIRELTSTFVKLKASGTDEVQKSMQALVDGIAKFGGSDEQLHRVTLGITQMVGKGVIQMEELRQQLGESMPTAMRIMARSMGVSVAELVDKISTGKVDARTALSAFYDELERAYGGSAQRMMQTFSGQVSQMNANLQKLATSGGLLAFFQSLKGYLQDFNSFLSSGSARQIADTLGAGLSAVATTFVTVIKLAYQFSSELKTLAIAATGALVIGRVTAMISGLGLAMTLAKAKTASAWAEMARGTGVMTASAASFSLVGTAAHAAGSRVAGLTMAARGLFGVVATMAPYLMLAGTAVYFLAEKFGLLGSKTDDAYASLVKYGAETRKQATEVLDAKESELQDEIDGAQADYDWDWNAPKYKTAKLARINALKAEMAEIKAERAFYIADATATEIEAEQQKIDRKLAMAGAESASLYDKKHTELDEWYATEIASAAKNGTSIKDIEDKYAAGSMELRKELANERIRLMDEEMAALTKLADDAALAGDESSRTLYSSLVDFIRAKRVEAFAGLKSLDNFVPGVSLVDNPGDGSEQTTAANNAIDKLQEDISGLQAEIAGASGEYGKMLFKIERGDFGSIKDGSKEVIALTEELKRATLQKEALDTIMKGRKDVEGDLKSLEAKVRNDRLELEARRSGKEMNEADKVLAKLKSGYYEGLGPIENIRAAIQNLASVTSTQGEIAAEAARVMSEQTFGDTMLAQIQRIGEAIFGVTGMINQMGIAAGGVSFSGITGGFGGGSNIRANVDGGLLDLIAQRESGGDYNATLDNGRWTGGARDLTSMTLNQIRELQRSMLTAENQRVHGGGGSSALGRYQIVGKTLQSLMDTMGLDGNALYDEKMQDMLALQLVKGRGRDATGLRNEWEGLNGVSDADIYGAYDRSASGPNSMPANAGLPLNSGGNGPIAGFGDLPALGGMDTTLYDDMEQDQVEYTNNAIERAEALSVELEKIAAENADLDLSETIKKLGDEAANAAKPVEDLGKNYQNMLDAIQAGDFGSDTNVNSARYTEALAAAKALDEVEKRRDDRKAATKASEEQLKELEKERAQLQKDIAEAQALAANPDYLGATNDLAKLNEEFEKYLENIATAYGADSEEYKTALAFKSTYLSDANALQRATIQADLASQQRDLSDSLLTEGQLRQTQMQRDLAIVDQRAEQLRAAGMSEVEITRETEALKAAIRAKYAQEGMTPMADQMAQWSDLQGNLQQSSAKWMDSAASGIAGLITGTGDLRSAVNGVISDVANMGVKYLMSQLMPATGKGASMKVPGSGGKGAGANASGKMLTGGKMPFGVKHSGGIVGQGGGMARMAHAAVFKGAAKFHGGGVAGGMRLGRNEVPIIAEKGEGIFTAEQMGAMGALSGGSNAMTINAPITVNGGGGTHQQNNDLAKQIGREMESTMRATVVDEMRKQTRPGNMMNNRGSR